MVFVSTVTKTTTITTTTELATDNKQIIDEEDYEREEHKYSAEEKPSPQPPLVRQERRKSTSSSESYSEVGHHLGLSGGGSIHDVHLNGGIKKYSTYTNLFDEQDREGRSQKLQKYLGRYIWKLLAFTEGTVAL